jgi:hypothetical protein
MNYILEDGQRSTVQHTEVGLPGTLRNPFDRNQGKALDVDEARSNTPLGVSTRFNCPVFVNKPLKSLCDLRGKPSMVYWPFLFGAIFGFYLGRVSALAMRLANKGNHLLPPGRITLPL